MCGQLQELNRGVDILVATPGRLVDLLERLKVSLKMIKYLTCLLQVQDKQCCSVPHFLEKSRFDGF